MMDEPREVFTATRSHGLADGHFQGLYADCGLQCSGQRPSHNHAGIGVYNQMEVADVTVGQGYVSDVGHPQLVGRGGDKALYQVLPFVVAVVGSRRVAGLGLGKQQPFTPQEEKETVTPGNI